MKIVKLIPRKNCKFHFGYLGLDINDTIFHSDSLFSTICNNFVRKYGSSKLDEFIQRFPLITSLFIGFTHKDKDLLFLPKPLIFRLPKETFERERKLIKKIKFISFGAYEKYMNDGLKDGEFTVSDDGFLYLNNECDDCIRIIEDVQDEKVLIDRNTTIVGEGPYTIASITLHENAFFYFLASDLFPELEESINLIERFGIGGELTTGYGQINKIKFDDFPENLFSRNGDCFVSLSIVFPTKNELSKVKAYWLIERKGYVYCTSIRRKQLLGFGEGSVFESKIAGSIVDVSPPASEVPYKVWRYGKAFLIPFKDVKGHEDEI